MAIRNHCTARLLAHEIFYIPLQYGYGDINPIYVLGGIIEKNSDPYCRFIFFFINICSAQQREISITIDDLPLVELPYEMFENIVHSFVKHQVPAMGFVIGSRVNNETMKQFLLFKQNGLELGNHTYSHVNLKRVSCKEYIHDIMKADTILAPFMSQPKYFRYPYLAEGTLWRKSIVRHYLRNNNYIVAPVTIDSRDFEFNIELIKQLGQDPTAPLTDLKNVILNMFGNVH